MEAYVNKASNKSRLLKINVDNHEELSDQYGVSSIPAFRIYDAKGKLVAEGDEAYGWVMEQLQK